MGLRSVCVVIKKYLNFCFALTPTQAKQNSKVLWDLLFALASNVIIATKEVKFSKACICLYIRLLNKTK